MYCRSQCHVFVWIYVYLHTCEVTYIYVWPHITLPILQLLVHAFQIIIPTFLYVYVYACLWVCNSRSHVYIYVFHISWWRHQMEIFSALLAICAGNSPVPGEFPTQRPVTRSFDVFFDLCPNKRLSKQLWGWWFETQSRPLWRHRNVFIKMPNHLEGINPMQPSDAT